MKQKVRKMEAVLLAAAVLAGVVVQARAVTVTSTIVRPLPRHQAIAPLNAGGQPQEQWSTPYNPRLPAGATLISSKVSGFVDDACTMGNVDIGMNSYRPKSFSDVELVSGINADGSFLIKLYDYTDDGTNANQVLLEGENTIRFSIDDPLPPDTSSTNIAKEVCGNPCEDGADPETTECDDDTDGCPSCSSKGSPRATFGLANFDVKLEDTPLWQETAVGAPLELRMRFSNYGETGPGRTFGPKWSCNWNSSVTLLDAATARMAFPSGSIGLFTLAPDGTYLPPDALTGVMVATNGGFEYRKPNGWTWTYGPSAGDADVYLLSSVRDAWSNTVAVTYDGRDRLVRVVQTAPATGRRLEFAYEGTNTCAASVCTEAAALRTATFGYSADGWLTDVVDMGGFAYGYEYTANGYLSRVLKGAAERLAVTYSATPDAWTATNSYWVGLADAGGFTRTYTWEFGTVKKVTTRGGAAPVESLYSVGLAGSRGRVLTGMTKANVSQDFQYTPRGRVSSRVDRLGGTWSQSYNDQLRLTSRTDPAGAVTTYVYDASGIDLLYEIPPAGPVQKVYTYVPGRHAVATESNALGRVVTNTYNSSGLLTGSSDGRTTETFTYDADGHLTSRSRNGTLSETNRYDAFGRLVWSRDAAGLEVARTYDGLNRLLTTTFDNDGTVSVETRHYDCCALDQLTDRRGSTWNYQYNDIGEKEWESNPNGLVTTYTYGLEGRPVAISNALEWTTREYTPEGWLSRVEYPARAFDSAHAENYWYDNEGRQVKRQTISGAYFKQEYDALGRRTAAYVPDGSTLPYAVEEYVLSETNRYDALGRLVWTRDIRGLAVGNTYDAIGQLVCKTYPDGTAERWTYDLWGGQTSFTDRAGNVVSNEFDALGRLTRTTDARGFATAYGYDDADRLVAVTNALGQVWSFAHDAEGHVTSVTYPDASVETRAYDAAGSLVQVVRGGVTTTYAYDALGNQTAVAVDGETIASATFDAAGRQLTAVNADGIALANTWDSWGQLDARAWPGGLQETFQYGDRGQTNATDRLGIPTRTVRDSLGRVLQTIDGATNANTVAYLPNGINQVAFLWDANSNRTAWAYDLYGNATGKTYADNSAETYQYDALSRLTGKTDPAGVATTYAYDAGGNLTSLQYSSLTPVTFAYDALGRRTSMTDAVGTTAWTYDSLGRLASESGPFGTPPVTAAYDALGRMTGVSFGSYSVTYAWDAKGRIVAVSAPEGAYSFSYFQNGIKRTRVSYPNGVAEARQYDTLARMTNLAFGTSATTLLAIAYAYDAGDRRTSERWSTGRAMGYAYDRAHQLLGTTSPARASDDAQYAYDPAGNPVRRKELGLATTYTFNNLNQLSSGTWSGALTVVGEANYAQGTVTVNNVAAQLYPDRTFEAAGIPVADGTNTLTAIYHGPAFTNTQTVATNMTTVVLANPAFAHDPNGNLTADGEFTYQYDLANRLTNVVNIATGARVLSCRYDALGRRVEAIRADGAIDRYIYFPGSFLVLAVLDGANNVKELYTRGPDLGGDLDTAGGIGGLLACTFAATPSAPLYYHSDPMGNVLALTDAAGSLDSSFQYTPFGRLSSRLGPHLPRFLFSSKEFDPETSLSYYGFRYYSPSLARWLTRDPIGEVDNILLYAFVINSPLRHCDSFGLETSFQTSQDDECCCTVTIIIELPNEDDEAKIERKGMAGHSGIAVDSEYYDYGPQPGEGASLMGSQGRPWWDRMSRLTSTEDAKLKDIEANIGKLAPGHEVYEVTIVAKSNECSVISQYWKDLYENPGTYKFFRKQCTTTVCLSLIQSGVANIKAYKPATLLNELRRKAKHTCGPNKGKPAEIKQISK